jgi:hypothetical protein
MPPREAARFRPWPRTGLARAPRGGRTGGIVDFQRVGMGPMDPLEPYEQAGPKTHASGKQGPIRGDSRNPWFLALLASFGTLTVLAIVFLRNEPHVETLTTPMWLALLGLAAIRLGRIVALDEVTQPFRAPFVDVHVIDGRPREVAKPHGFRGAVGALLSSPDSIGFWMAGILVYGWILWPSGFRILIVVLAVSGLGEILNGVVHFLGNRAHGRTPVA